MRKCRRSPMTPPGGEESPRPILISDAIRAACLCECRARKPGNVHPAASFDDLTFDDFVRSTEAIAPVLAADSRPLGETILKAVGESRRVSGSNAHLGTILLLAPLARSAAAGPPREEISSVLNSTTIADAEAVYRAIHLAAAGGLGKAAEQDLATPPTVTLTEAMRLAEARDTIALQYATDFRLVFDWADRLSEQCDEFNLDWERTVVTLFIQLLTEVPDTLIARKRGRVIAEQVSRKASALATLNPPADSAELAEFDRFLRSDGNALNPGTTADLIAAILFVAFAEGRVHPPVDI